MNETELFIFNLFVFIPAILIGVSVHESSHGLAALWLGDDTAKLEGRITLNPVKHITWVTLVFAALSFIPGFMGFIPFKPVPINHEKLSNPRWGAGLTAMAGPLSNLLLAIATIIICKLLVFFIGVQGVKSSEAAFWVVKWLLVFSIFQIMLFIFNMIPIPPLDGHWVLGSVFPPLHKVFQFFRESMIGFLVIIIILFIPAVRDAINGFFNDVGDLIITLIGMRS